MWLITLFDLPVLTTQQRRDYTRFRKSLLKDGFIMLQYSVYARYCVSEEASAIHQSQIQNMLPDEGEIRILRLTDHQFGKMQVFWGEKRQPTEARPLQLEFF
jgi:CRISPR-associated protein Cas2